MGEAAKMDDSRFVAWWTSLTDEQRSEEGQEAFTRYRRIMGIGNSPLRVIPNPNEPPPSLWPPPIDLVALGAHEPMQPRFIIQDWLPCGYATLFAGHGGVGKSGLALHLCTAIALGGDFFGLQCEPRKVLYLSCEDRENVLHYRLARICKHIGIPLADLAGYLNIVDLVGKPSILWERDPRTGFTSTAALAELERMMEETGSDVVAVDGISDTFGGNENAKVDVKRYVNALVNLIDPNKGAVLLVGHVAKLTAAQASTTEGYSGTTGWHNAVRARWYLYPESRPGEEGEKPERTGDLLLELQKSNLGTTDQSMRFTWNEDSRMFHGREIQGRTAAAKSLRDSHERRVLLEVLAEVHQAAGHVPAASQGPRNAFAVLSGHVRFPDSLMGPEGRRRFWRHIQAMIMSGSIQEVTYRSGERKRAGLAPAALSNRQG